MANIEITGESNVSGVVGADLAKVSQQINQVSKAGQDASSGGLTALSHAMGLVGAVGALAGVVAATEQLYELGGAAQEAASTLEALSSGQAPQYIDAITTASDGMISRLDAATIANKALNAGFFTSADQLAGVTNAATQLADVMGVDTVQAENLLIDAIDKGNMRLLAQAGIVMKGKDAQAAINALMAADPRLDATSAAQMAAYNAVLERSNQLEALGVGAKRSAGDSAERLSSSVANLTSILGQWVSTALQPAVDGATNLVGGIVSVNDAINQQRQSLMDSTGSFEDYVAIAKTIPGLMGEVNGAGAAGIANLERQRAAWNANREAIVANASALATNARDAEALQNIQIETSSVLEDMTARTNDLSSAIDVYNQQINEQAGRQLSLLQSSAQLTDAWTIGQAALAQMDLTGTEALSLYTQLGLATGNLTTSQVAWATEQSQMNNLLGAGLMTMEQWVAATNNMKSGMDAATVSAQTHTQAVNSLYNSLISQGVPSMEAWASAQQKVTATEEGTSQTAAELTTMIDNYNIALSQMKQPDLITFRETGGADLSGKLATIKTGMDSINAGPFPNITVSDGGTSAAVEGRVMSVHKAADSLLSGSPYNIVVNIDVNGSVPTIPGSGGPAGGAKAKGGPVSGGTPYLVGEEGPELFVPTGGGSIVPAGETAAMMQGGGDTYYVTIMAQSGDVLTDLMAQAQQLQGDS